MCLLREPRLDHAHCFLMRDIFLTDLPCSRMSDGKKTVFKLADPRREESVIRGVFEAHPLQPPRLTSEPDQGYCSAFVDLYRLGDDHSLKANLYRKAAYLLLPLLQIECNHSTVVRFLPFLGNTEPEFKRLLEEKDSRALLLLAIWYAKVCRYNAWWIQTRAVLECQALCIYLERYHSDEGQVQGLLCFPRAMSGLDTIVNHG